jgi:nucleotide-binding universal stress UspA family protein
MTQTTTATPGGATPGGATPADVTPGRIFLVVIDDSVELSVALAYACRRARHSGGRVALLYVMEPTEFQNWRMVEDLMREERRLEAEQRLQRHAKEVHRLAGTVPVLYLREGERREQLLRLIDEDRSISILVLAASSGPEGPGPLISYLATAGYTRLRIPVTIVPGTLSQADIEAVS